MVFRYHVSSSGGMLDIRHQWLWIESDLYAREGNAVTNFGNALPPDQSDLANEILRDPYNFDFLTLRNQAAERDLEEGLLAPQDIEAELVSSEGN